MHFSVREQCYRFHDIVVGTCTLLSFNSPAISTLGVSSFQHSLTSCTFTLHLERYYDNVMTKCQQEDIRWIIGLPIQLTLSQLTALFRRDIWSHIVLNINMEKAYNLEVENERQKLLKGLRRRWLTEELGEG